MQASHPSCTLCGATRDRHDVHLLLDPVGIDAGGDPSRIQVAVVGATDAQDELVSALETELEGLDVLGRDETTLGLVVEGIPKDGVPQLYPTVHRVSGPTTLFLPGVVTDGWMTLPFYTTSGTPGTDLVRSCKEDLAPAGFDLRLVRFGAFQPGDLLSPNGELTDKQLEVVRAAFSMGYYETPRNCTLDDLADVFGISKAAVHMRLRTAERKIMREFV